MSSPDFTTLKNKSSTKDPVLLLENDIINDFTSKGFKHWISGSQEMVPPNIVGVGVNWILPGISPLFAASIWKN